MNYKNILFPINLDSKHLKHLNEALSIAQTLKAQLHFLYVNDPMAGYRHPTDREDAVAMKVQEIAKPDVLASIKVVYSISKGNLGDEVKKYCTDKKIDLIIVGHKHRGKIYSNLFDSPDESIIDTINIPVLIIPKQ